MFLAHGDVALNFWATVLLLVFVLPLVLLVIYRKKPFAALVAFTWVCIGVSALLIYLMMAPR
jgi:hypothetical protein